MPLLHNGKVQDNDPWTLLTDDDDLPSDLSYAVVSIGRYLALQESGAPLPAGVVVVPADNVQTLAKHLNNIKLVAISFPAYTDGRGYSHARKLRKRLNYTGELRAVGDIREDQVLFMIRLGIDSFVFPEQPNTELLGDIVKRYETSYQPSYA